ASGLTLLFDATTARVMCVMESAYISSLRTASVTALATERLAAPPVRCMAVLGAGALARAHLELLPRRLPDLTRVLLFDSVPGRARDLADEFRPRLRAVGATLEVTSTPDEAIRPAQLV